MSKQTFSNLPSSFSHYQEPNSKTYNQIYNIILKTICSQLCRVCLLFSRSTDCCKKQTHFNIKHNGGNAPAKASQSSLHIVRAVAQCRWHLPLHTQYVSSWKRAVNCRECCPWNCQGLFSCLPSHLGSYCLDPNWLLVHGFFRPSRQYVLHAPWGLQWWNSIITLVSMQITNLIYQ